VVVVIGGANSNNTRELVRTCRRDCSRVHHVQTAADLRRTWFARTDTVGITAGTSTPDSLIDTVEQALSRLWGDPSRSTARVHPPRTPSRTRRDTALHPG
jgi:4-hydroxy-3-methylbut-2-enyl diphosphate reductase